MRRPDALSDLPRLLHPAAWWLWGLGLATAASRTTNPFLLLLVVAVAAWVVMERREVGATNVFCAFLVIGLVAIGLRVVTAGPARRRASPARVVLVRLPEVPLPAWAAGVRLGGPVTLEGLLAAAYDGLRLAAILACLGAANALASPRRLLRYVPATLYDVGTAVVVALTFAPQMVQDAGRVRAARRLRGHSTRGLRSIARLAVPVLAGALDRSLDLAASMESRGYGRAVHRTDASRRGASALALGGLLGVLAGLYGLLDASAPALLGLPLVAGRRRAGRPGAARRRPARDPVALPPRPVGAAGVAGVVRRRCCRRWCS